MESGLNSEVLPRAKQALEAGQYQDAWELARQALRHVENRTEGLLIMGHAQVALGDPDQALACYARAGQISGCAHYYVLAARLSLDSSDIRSRNRTSVLQLYDLALALLPETTKDEFRNLSEERERVSNMDLPESYKG